MPCAASGERMAFNLGLFVEFFGKSKGFTAAATKATKGLNDVERAARTSKEALEQQRRQTRWLRRSLVALGVTLLGVSIGFLKAAKTAGEFDRQMQGVRLITGASAKQMAGLRDITLSMGAELGVVPLQAAKAEVALGRLGFRAHELEKVLRPTLGIVAAGFGEVDAERAAQLLGQTLKSFGKNASEATEIGNQLARATAVSALDFKKMGLAIGTAGGFAAQFGAQTHELLALLGAARDVISRTERAATGVRNIFVDLTKIKVQQRFRQMGIEVATADGRFRNILDIVEQLHGRLQSLSDAQRLQTLQTVFSIEAAGVLGAIFQRLDAGVQTLEGRTLRGAAAMRFLANEVRNGSLTLEELQQALLGGAAGTFDRLTAQLNRALISIGDTARFSLIPVLDVANFALGSFAFILSKAPASIQFMVGTLGLLLQMLVAILPSLLLLPVTLQAIGVGFNFAAIKSFLFSLSLKGVFLALGKLTIFITAAAIILEGLLWVLGKITGRDFSTPTFPELPQLPGGSIDASVAAIETGQIISAGSRPAGATRRPLTVPATEEFLRVGAVSREPGREGTERTPNPAQTRLNAILNIDGRRFAKLTADIDSDERSRRFEKPTGVEVRR